MALLVGFTINIEHAFDSTYAELVPFYLANRISEAVYLLFMAYILPMARGMLTGSVLLILIHLVLWIASIHIEEPDRLAVIWIAITFDIVGNGALVPIVRSSEKWGAGRLEWLARHFQFYPAANMEHRTERMSAFVTLICSYLVVASTFLPGQYCGRPHYLLREGSSGAHHSIRLQHALLRDRFRKH